MKTSQILIAVVLITLSTLCALSQNKNLRNNSPGSSKVVVKSTMEKQESQEGTTYHISNQTNVLVVWMNGDCGPTVAGEIYTEKPITIFVEKGGSRKVTFAARFSAPKCGHCYTKVLTGDGASDQYINLKPETFCY